MKSLFTPTIYTKRLSLRSIQDGDLADLSQILNSEEIAKTYILPTFNSLEEVLSLAKKLMALSNDYTRFVYAICLDNRLIGWVNDVFMDKNTVELGYVIHPDYKNNGYATESLKASINEIFRVGFTVVKAGAFEGNVASQCVMQKSGMAKSDEIEIIEYRGNKYRVLIYEIRG